MMNPYDKKSAPAKKGAMPGKKAPPFGKKPMKKDKC